MWSSASHTVCMWSLHSCNACEHIYNSSLSALACITNNGSALPCIMNSALTYLVGSNGRIAFVSMSRHCCWRLAYVEYLPQLVLATHACNTPGQQGSRHCEWWHHWSRHSSRWHPSRSAMFSSLEMAAELSRQRS